MIDTHYLREDQYKDSSDLQARANIHERFSTNPYGWLTWVFDQIALPEEARILELGSGGAFLWSEIAERIPDHWDITLTDFSEGMPADAAVNLGQLKSRFTFTVMDAQEIRFEDASFDAVIANHMLYHVPDREKTFTGVRRVLKPGGRFYAATNGLGHLQELFELSRTFYPGLDKDRPSGIFGLENGLDQLSPWFENIELRRYEDSLKVTDADALVKWAQSWAKRYIEASKLDSFYEFLRSELARSGVIHVTKDSGLFIATKEA